MGGCEGAAYVALGIGSLFNHNEAPNLEVWLDEGELTIQFLTTRDVAEGEELCISYHHLPPGYDFGAREKLQGSEETVVPEGKVVAADEPAADVDGPPVSDDILQGYVAGENLGRFTQPVGDGPDAPTP